MIVGKLVTRLIAQLYKMSAKIYSLSLESQLQACKHLMITRFMYYLSLLQAYINYANDVNEVIARAYVDKAR